MLEGKFEDFYQKTKLFIDTRRIITNPLRCLAYGTDASFYRLIPKIVINTINEKEVALILKTASETGVAITFRAAGTSLSGQAVTDSVLVRLGRGWNRYHIHEGATKIDLEPGIIGGRANQFLSGYQKKIGPDPASIDTAKIGGIIANNASGMCCGVAENSYHTLVNLRLVLIDGTILDTGDDFSRKAFIKNHPEIIKGIETLRDRVKNDTTLKDRIIRKFKIKNTTGYSLNALVDFNDPFEILQHLMVGSEGTLGFISRVTYRTVEEMPCKASALAVFTDIHKACQAVIMLKSKPVSAVELMDRASLTAVENKDGMPGYLKKLNDTAAALLIETRAQTREELLEQVQQIIRSLDGIDTVMEIEFKENPEDFNKLWNIRKGLFPAVGSVRQTGTTVIIEDVAFPIKRLAEATLDLQELFKKYHYNEAIIFGHALEGNLHFVFTQDFSSVSEIERYAGFMDEVASLVVGTYDGSLKAEHGTGRNMAPFVELEWGRDAFALMQAIKTLFDPKNLLNPGVILNPDPIAHLKHLKPLPPANSLVDQCIECGFCEPVCPSRDLSFTPRQRITSWREICRKKSVDPYAADLRQFLSDYRYFGSATCAVDGLCGTRCPVGIDTGKLTKTLKADQISHIQKNAAARVADHFGKTAASIGSLLLVADVIHTLAGTKIMENASQALHDLPGKKIPKWNNAMPRKIKPIKPSGKNRHRSSKVVYFPSCASRTFGPSKNDGPLEPLPFVTLSLLEKAGYEVIFPKSMERLCCGQAFESKGFFAQADQKSDELSKALLDASMEGKLPILCDTSPCLKRMKETLDPRLNLYEPVAFTLTFLTGRLNFIKQDRTIAIHIPCSSWKLGLEKSFRALAETCAAKVILPEGIYCCGFSGDKGFSVPELNASALEDLAEKVTGCSGGYTTSRTCEIGLTLHGKIPYRSIFYLVDECTTD